MINLKGIILTVSILASLAGCVASSNSNVSAQFDRKFLNDRVPLIQSVANSSELVLVGKIVAISLSPADWSGRFKVTQTVIYEVVSVLKGSWSISQIVVSYPIVKGAHYLDNAKPQLSSEFIVGAEKIVMITLEDGVYEPVDHQVGTIPFSAANKLALESML